MPEARSSSSVNRCSTASGVLLVSARAMLVYAIRRTPVACAASTTVRCWASRCPASLPETKSSRSTPVSAAFTAAGSP